MSKEDDNTSAPPMSGILRRPRKRKASGAHPPAGAAPEPPAETPRSSSHVRPEFTSLQPTSGSGGQPQAPTEVLLGRAPNEDAHTIVDPVAETYAPTLSPVPHRPAETRATTPPAASALGATDPRTPRPVDFEGANEPTRLSLHTSGSMAVPSEAAPVPQPPAAPRQASTQPPAIHGGGGTELTLPGYEVIRFFGKGGMGEVFLADRLSSTGVRVRCVVKTIKEGLENQAQFEDLFLDEARIIAELRHPNITSVVDVGRANGRLYMAMEWIDGVDAAGLAKRAGLRGGDIPLPHLLYLLRETLQGLHYAHTALGNDGTPLNLVHRDISQGNILISKHGAVKLADFGVAVGSNIQTEGSAENLAGKPHYFGPELWRGSRASAGTDVFALGVTFYEMLSAGPLFSRDKDLRALAFEICEFRVEDLIESDLTIPDGLEDILLRALHQNPAERYQSALEFLEDVNDYAYEYGIRLLDAHFGEYVARMVEEEGTRSSLWKA